MGEITEAVGASVAFEAVKSLAANALARNGFTQCRPQGSTLDAVAHGSFRMAAAGDARRRQWRPLRPVITIQALLAVDAHRETLKPTSNVRYRLVIIIMDYI